MKPKISRIIAAMLSACFIVSAAACSNEQNNTSNTVSEKTYSISDDEDTAKNNNDDTSADNTESSLTDTSYDDASVPDIEDPTPQDDGEYINGLLVYNGVAYEQFFGDDDMAENYSDVISTIKNSLGSDIKMYNVLIPTHCGITLPDKFKDTVASQEEYLNTITNSYSAEGIIPVNTYSTMMQHRDEYLYFNTDHHWTGRAAYYAYADFCKAARIDAIPISSMTSKKIEGYQGSLADSDIPGLDNLKDDYVEYFTVDMDISTTLYDDYGNDPTDYALLHEYAEGINAYGVFLGGDQPIIVSKNSDGNGKKIAVVKESYGNAFCPFIAYTYSETHMIDSRYAEINLNQYLRDNDINEVIFINNAMASATYQRCEELRSLVD